MKKQTLFLSINAVVMLIISLGVMLIIKGTVTQNPEDLLFGQMVDLENQVNIEDPSGNSYSIVDFKANAVNGKGETIGVVYNVKIKNSFDFSGTKDKDYGYIELLVGIKDDMVTVEIVSLEQTITYVANIQRYIYTSYDSVPYLSVESIPSFNAAPDADLESGATASTSTGAIHDIIWKAVQMNYDLYEDDPFIAILGEDYVVENDSAFIVTDHVSAKQNITTSSLVPDGYIYTVTGTGDYEGYDGTHSGSITLQVVFDANDQIVTVYVPEDLYEHTVGYMGRNETYLNEFVGKTLAEISTVISDNSDLKTGATYSRTLIDSILEALVSEVDLDD